MDRTFRLILLVFAALTVSLCGVVLLSITNLQRANRSAQWVNHTHAYITEINAALAANQQAESALQAYLISDSPAQEMLFRQAFAELAEHMEVAQALNQAEPDSTDDLAELESALVQRADRARALLAAHRNGKDAATKAQLQDRTENAGAEAVSIANRIVRNQQTLLRDRDRIAFERDSRARSTLYIGASLNLLLIVTAGWSIRDNLNTRRREAALLASANEELEARVKARTAELAKTNLALRTENIENRWAAQALQHQVRYNNLIIECVASPVLVITKAFKISRVNPAMEKLVGHQAPRLVDQPLSEFVRLKLPDEEGDLINAFENALRMGRDMTEQPAEITDPRGEPQPILVSLFPLRDHDRVVGGVVTLRIPSTTT